MAQIAAVAAAMEAGVSILETIPEIISQTQKIVTMFDGATDFKDRCRSLELAIINATDHKLTFSDEHFDSGTWFVSPKPLTIQPGEISILFVANRQVG